jgi:hypothetical protein
MKSVATARGDVNAQPSLQPSLAMGGPRDPRPDIMKTLKLFLLRVLESLEFG